MSDIYIAEIRIKGLVHASSKEDAAAMVLQNCLVAVPLPGVLDHKVEMFAKEMTPELLAEKGLTLPILPVDTLSES